MKNQKISKSLKHYHKHKRVMKEVKTILWAILILTIVCQFRPAGVIAEEEFNKNYSLPVAEDKTELKDKVIAEIIKQARLHGINETEALSVSYCESFHDPYIKNWQGSSAGGAWQFTDGTFLDGIRWRGLDWKLEDKFDYKKATDMAMWFVSREGWGRWKCAQLLN